MKMNNIAKLVLLLAANSLFLVNANADGIEDSQLGLTKEPLKDITAPSGFSYSDKFPGSSEVLPRSYQGAPPQIPHNIESFIPVTKDNNMCKGCHDTPDNIGKPRAKGTPTPIPASHYTDLRFNTPQGKQLVGARTVCTQCHVPQAQVTPLVENQFKNQ